MQQRLEQAVDLRVGAVLTDNMFEAHRELVAGYPMSIGVYTWDDARAATSDAVNRAQWQSAWVELMFATTSRLTDHAYLLGKVRLGAQGEQAIVLFTQEALAASCYGF